MRSAFDLTPECRERLVLPGSGGVEVLRVRVGDGGEVWLAFGVTVWSSLSN
jgi:hypothetical protein